MCFAVSLVLQAQNYQNLYGRAIDQKSGQTIPFASIGLFTWGDSVIIGSSLSDDSGLFRFNSVTRGKYILKIQHVGYQLFTGTIDLEAMKDRGIIGTNTAGSLDDTVADLILGLIISTARRFIELDKYVRDGKS